MGRVCEICSGQHYAKNRCRVHYVFPSKLNPKSIAKAVKPIRQVSSKQAKLNRAYLVIRNEYMKAHKVCEARLPGCTYNATECHHSKGRGEFMLDQTSYKALCHACHVYIELHPKEAKIIGLSASRLDI